MIKVGKKKKKKKIKFKIKNIIVLSIILGFLGIISYCFITMPIENIYIQGNNIIDDNEIMELVNIEDYPSFILTNRFYIKEKLLTNPYIKSVTIKKKIGNILEIKIIENTVVATTTEGTILLSNGKELPNNYQLYDIPLLLNKINNQEVYKLFALKMEKVDTNILRQISEIEYSPVEVDNERFIFYMCDGNLVHITLTKINKINKYNQIKDKLENQKGTIYLDSGDYIELSQ